MNSSFDLTSTRSIPDLLLANQLRHLERQLSQAPIEVALLNDTGQLLTKVGGLVDRVIFSPEQLTKVSGQILTHNYSLGGFFSLQDAQFAADFDLQAIRAVVGRWVLILTRPAAGWDLAAFEAYLKREVAGILRHVSASVGRLAAPRLTGAGTTAFAKPSQPELYRLTKSHYETCPPPLPPAYSVPTKKSAPD